MSALEYRRIETAANECTIRLATFHWSSSLLIALHFAAACRISSRNV